MILSILKVVVLPRKRKDALEILKSLLEPTQVKPGCISCRAYQDLSNKNAFALVEEWESKADLDNHILSDEYKMILALMDISSETPEMKFNLIADSTGLEKIEAVRKPVRTEQ